MRKLGFAVAGLLAGVSPIAALAQDRPEPSPTEQPPESADFEGDEGPEIVVSGELRGAVPGDIKPELTLSAGDVRAYGVASIGDLITELAPQTGSGRGRDGGRPVMLLNGRRISGFAEIRDLPTEAIERVDILPEEAALKFGYRADQRVVNIVLRNRFRSISTELEGRVPTAGGNSKIEGDFGVVKINRDKRINIDVKYTGTSGLLESERGIRRDTTELFDSRGNIGGNIGGIGGTEIDPALSGLVGSVVTVAGVPVGAAGSVPTLGSFVPGANLANSTDLTPYRTLVQPQQELAINGVYSRNLSNKVSATFNASLESVQRQSLLGLPGVTFTLPQDNSFSPFANNTLLYRYIGTSPLTRDSKSLTAHGGFSLNGDGLPWSKDWRWSVTGNYDRVTTRSVTDRGFDPAPAQALLNANAGLNPFGEIPLGALGIHAADLAESTSSVGSLDALMNGALFKLPAGQVNTAVRVRGTTSDLESESVRSGDFRSASLGRDSGSVQANFDLPITSRRYGVLGAIGDLTLNGNVEVEQLSDFGTLVTTGYGVNWSPVKQVRFIASFTDEEGAPSAAQLGDPIIATPLVRVFDYVRGESVDITAVTGGNPLLLSDSRHVMKLGVNIRPFDETDLTFNADYVSSTTRNQIASFPAATAAVEAAFPDRFVRDSDEQLISIDNRSVNFARAERSQLRWGVNFSKRLTSAFEKQMQARRAARDAAMEKSERDGTPLPAEFQRRPGQGPGQGQGQGAGQQQPQGGFFGGGGPGAGGPRGGGGGMGGRGGGGMGGGGRFQFSLYHSWYFKDQITIRDDLPVLDLLSGGATGSSGGRSQHEIEAQTGVSRDGLGFRLIGKWQSATSVNSGALGSGEQLDFSSLGTLNLRLFADLGQRVDWARKHRWMRGARVTLSVDNIFDSRQRVTDALGVVPTSYQPGLIDPTGRTVRLSFRKLFF